MKQIVALSLCFLMFSAFDWGWGAKKEVPVKKTSQEIVSTSETEAAAYESKAPSKPVVQSVKSNEAASTSINPEGIVSVSRLLGSGTPEERQVRMESMKRLGEALRKKNA